MHYYLHLNLGGMFYRSHSVYGMLILSLTGNRIRGTPIWSYYIINTFDEKVNTFCLFSEKFLIPHKKDGSKSRLFLYFDYTMYALKLIFSTLQAQTRATSEVTPTCLQAY